MKISDLTLKSFGSHAATSLKFKAPIAMIVGGLNSGKTTILNAAEYALLGECGFYRKKTDDRTELIHGVLGGTAAPGFSVDLFTDKGHAMRTRGLNGESWMFNDKPMAGVSAMDTAVTDALGVSKVVLSAALNVSNFFELDAATQKELIIGLIGAEVTHDKVKALFIGDPEALALLQGRIDSLQAITNAHQYSYDRRTVVRRELKELKPPEPPVGTAPPIDKIRALLAQLDGELQTKIAERARLEGSGQIEKVRADLETRRKFVARSIEAGKPDSKKKAALQNALDTEKTAHAEAAVLMQTMEGKMRGITADFLVREKNIALLAKFDGRCVAGDHVCPAPKADMQAALREQESALEKSRKTYQDFEREIKLLAQRRDDTASIKAAEKSISDFEKTEEQYASAQDDLRQIDDQLSKLVAPDPTRMAALAAEIDKLKERITKGRQQLESANDWLTRERQVQSVAATRAKLERELAYLEQLVDFFGPKGVKVQLIDERIGLFERQINQHLSAFGYEMRVQIEPWRLMVSGRPITMLSRSERFRLGISFQIGIAKMTGLNFVVCDDTEMLTPEVRGQMIKMLLEAKLDQAIVIMTLMDPVAFQASAKKFPPALEVFWVKNESGVSRVEHV